jgi:hypothetical protein
MIPRKVQSMGHRTGDQDWTRGAQPIDMPAARPVNVVLFRAGVKAGMGHPAEAHAHGP